MPLLGPGKPRHGRRVGGTPLDQGQGLQHRVVQVRRDVGTLSGADAGRLLVSEIAPEAEDPRCGEDGNADEGGEDRADHLPDLAHVGLADEQPDEAERGEDEPTTSQIHLTGLRAPMGSASSSCDQKKMVPMTIATMGSSTCGSMPTPALPIQRAPAMARARTPRRVTTTASLPLRSHRLRDLSVEAPLPSVGDVAVDCSAVRRLRLPPAPGRSVMAPGRRFPLASSPTGTRRPEASTEGDRGATKMIRITFTGTPRWVASPAATPPMRTTARRPHERRTGSRRPQDRRMRHRLAGVGSRRHASILTTRAHEGDHPRGCSGVLQGHFRVDPHGWQR